MDEEWFGMNRRRLKVCPFFHTSVILRDARGWDPALIKVSFRRGISFGTPSSLTIRTGATIQSGFRIRMPTRGIYFLTAFPNRKRG